MTELSEIVSVLEDVSDHLANLVEAQDKSSDEKPLIPFLPEGWRWSEPEVIPNLRDGATGYKFRVYKEDGSKEFEDSVYITEEEDVDDIDEAFSFVLNMLVSSAESYGRDFRQEVIDKWVDHVEFESFLS